MKANKFAWGWRIRVPHKIGHVKGCCKIGLNNGLCKRSCPNIGLNKGSTKFTKSGFRPPPNPICGQPGPCKKSRHKPEQSIEGQMSCIKANNYRPWRFYPEPCVGVSVLGYQLFFFWVVLKENTEDKPPCSITIEYIHRNVQQLGGGAILRHTHLPISNPRLYTFRARSRFSYVQEAFPRPFLHLQEVCFPRIS